MIYVRRGLLQLGVVLVVFSVINAKINVVDFFISKGLCILSIFQIIFFFGCINLTYSSSSYRVSII